MIPAHMNWSSSWWLVVSRTVWMGTILGEAPTVANFWWEVVSSLFYISKPLFWLFGWWWSKIWCEGKSICGGALSIANFWRRWPPAQCMLPTCQISWGRFCFWQCRQVVGSSGCVVWVWSLALSSGVVSVVACVSYYPGCVIKG